MPLNTTIKINFSTIKAMKLKKIVTFSMFLFYLVGYSQCGNPNYQGSPVPGFVITDLLKENFGTMSTANGTNSVQFSSLTAPVPTSNYIYYQATAGQVPTSSSTGTASPGASLQDGYYTVFNNIQQTASFANGLWQTIGDHTNGGTTPTGGRMLIVNAGSPGRLYSKTITGITTGVPLNISLWAMNLDIATSADNRNKPNLTITLTQNGATVYSFQTGDIPKEAAGSTSAWKNYKNSTTFVPTSTATITLTITSNNSSGGGNDLAIDDILVYQYQCDTDGDGVVNANDLDNDNDGILNTNECVTSIGSVVIWSGDGTYGLNPEIQSPAVINSASPATSGTGISSLDVYLSSYRLRGISTTSTTIAAAITENDYIEYQFQTSNWNTNTPGSEQYVFDKTSVYHKVENPQNYRFSVVISSDNFVTNTILLSDINGLKANSSLTYDNYSPFILSPNQQYKVRVYFYSLSNPTPTTADYILFDNFTVRVTKNCDTDGDGIPDYLDLDSDGDGCPDAIEGGGNFMTSQLSTATGSLATQTVNKNLGNTVGTTTTTNGVPTIAGTGQTVGYAQNAAINKCLVCYKPGILDTGNTYPTKHGITGLGRAGANNENWPMSRQSAWTVLESKEKGFVINRVATTAGLTNITNPVEGMMVYDEEASCLKIYTLKSGDTVMGWHCFITPACPD